MGLKIFVIEANPVEINRQLLAAGERATDPAYVESLRSLDPSADYVILDPMEKGRDCLPPGLGLADADGVAITGSALNVYADDDRVRRQLDLVRQVVDAGVPAFGSCWGLQILATALGGSVRRNPKGREIGISEPISLTAAGLAHPMYQGKQTPFTALTMHQDEVETQPEGATLLASNAFSRVQAFAASRNGAQYWGVQYHPEYDLPKMAGIMRRLADSLVAEHIFPTTAAVLERSDTFDAFANQPIETDHARAEGITPDVLNPGMRLLELANWLDALKSGALKAGA